MRRGLRALVVAAAAWLLVTPIAAPPPLGPGSEGSARLFAERVPLNPDAPDERRFGPLHYVDGWVLSSDDRRFGAISALAVVEDGRLLALSDQGMLLRFPAPPEGDQVEIIPLAEGPGEAGSKRDRDSESMALADGALWIGYENSNQVWRYDARTLRASAHTRPEAMRRWSANRGAEAMVRLAGGRFLVIREDVDYAGVSDALLFLGDPALAGTQAVKLRIDPPPEERVTDGALLPDGRLLLLTRRLGFAAGWAGHLLLARMPQGEETMIATEVAAAFEAPITRDNMEAIAVTQESGRTIVWIASDDNLFGLQRTLLLKFEWAG